MVLGRVHKTPNIFSLLGPGDLITVQAGEHLSTWILATRLVEVYQTIFAWDAYTESDKALCENSGLAMQDYMYRTWDIFQGKVLVNMG